MFGHIQRQIRDQQALVLEDREALRAHGHALGYQLYNKLATPKALAGGFGAGVLAALLRCRRPASGGSESGEDGSSRSQQMLGWLLRDIVMPVALGAFTQAQQAHADSAEDEL